MRGPQPGGPGKDFNPEATAVYYAVSRQMPVDPVVIGTSAEPDAVRIVCMRGFLDAPRTGKYCFSGRSAKGARGRFQLFAAAGRFTESDLRFSEFGGQTTDVYLAEGKHPIVLILCQGAAGRDFSIRWEGPGIARGDVPAAARSHLPE